MNNQSRRLRSVTTGNPSSFGERQDICKMREGAVQKNFLINRSSSKPFFFLIFPRNLEQKTFNRAGFLNKV